ncbi:hypothetical protein AB0L05_16850 [Nonomuraea pusilla]|uniref:hypothetical protein n=1 Tax=Nonomuraea pusilla TaxID=46177 RepID=UPI00332BE601
MQWDSDGFFSWTATDHSGRGTCGVTAEAERATALLSRALVSLAPGATGTVQVVYLDRLARYPSYVYGSTLLRLCRVRADVIVVSG